jgi:hypothetical protein
MFTPWHQVALCVQTHRATQRFRMLIYRYGELLRANPGAVGLVDLKRLKEELPISFPAQRPPAYVAGGDADCIVDVQAVQVRAGAQSSTDHEPCCQQQDSRESQPRANGHQERRPILHKIEAAAFKCRNWRRSWGWSLSSMHAQHTT